MNVFPLKYLPKGVSDENKKRPLMSNPTTVHVMITISGRFNFINIMFKAALSKNSISDVSAFPFQVQSFCSRIISACKFPGSMLQAADAGILCLFPHRLQLLKRFDSHFCKNRSAAGT